MTQEDQAFRFGRELQQLVNHYLDEYPDMMSIILIGILETQSDQLKAMMNQIEFKKTP